MRHANRNNKLNRTSSHRRCMLANMLKSLIVHGRVETTVAKAKELRRYADRMITLSKKDTPAARRLAEGRLMVRFNTLSPKEQRAAKNGDTSSYNDDRRVLDELFNQLRPRFATRQGGYTRIIRLGDLRVGDNAEKCLIEFVE
jgi:large subunit ribosomal protein L17